MTRTMQRPRALCAHPSGCPDFAVPGRHHCPEHDRSRNRQRYDSREQAAYRAPSYVNARKALLAKYGEQCWACHGYPSDGNPATCHHIDGDNENNAETNLAVLCRSCHSTLEREVDRGAFDGPTHDRLRETLEGLGRPVDGRFFRSTGTASRPSLSHTAASFEMGGTGGGE